VLFGFPADFGKAAGKAVVTGNPVRKEILEMPSPATASPTAAARCASWWWAAAWARRC
jgi:UDP-N-acetylglucosamine:LPS N-acetylglucosamine transferase